MRHSIALLALLLGMASAVPAAQQSRPLFTFHSNAWLNLHQFVRLVARGGPPPTEVPRLSDQERAQWVKGVEFYAPYLGWTIPYAKEVRTQLDDLGLRCYSTHNPSASLMPGDTMSKAIEINQVLGARHIIMASPPPNTASLDDWKRVSGRLAEASAQLAPHGLLAGFHNHRIEWNPLEGGQRVMDVIAANTPAEFVLQFDVGTCLEAGQDPVAWIKAHPGRIRSLHLKDWAPGAEADQKGYRVLFGEGVAPWKEILAAAEATGGVEFYLMEQEGSRFSELETAQRCLATWRDMRGKA